ncbi:type VI secretion system baseplate subunit TssK [Hylemonella sp. W303a]|uniref:type VI secretion system baseplate subunit TssK n=1 Tax=Hylemonella sp. W303a TaxID=3389873 RepID=UPI00396B2AEB
MQLIDSLPEAVQWTEGMLLSPQHFQQQDIYWQSQLQHLLALQQPHGWGLVSLEFDPAALAQHVLRVIRLHAVTPDGLVVQFPGHHESSLELNLAKLDWTQESLQRVSLAVPRRERGAATPGSAIQRFDPVPGTLESDETLPDSKVEVSRLRPRLELLAGPVPPRYAAVPLLDVFRDPVGSLRLGVYVPPALRLDAGEFLDDKDPMRRVRRLIDTVRVKLRDLAGSRRPEDNASRLTEDAQRTLMVARGLAVMLPSMELMVANPATHPHALYLELSRMVGQMAVLATNPTPPVLKPYQHEDVRPGIEQMLDFLEGRLALISPMYEAMFFERESEFRFSRLMAQGTTVEQFIVELRPRPGQDAQALARWLGQCTIGREDMLMELQRRRLPGATCVPVSARELPGLNVPDDAQLFRIRINSLDVEGQTGTGLSAGGRWVIEHAAQAQGPSEIVWHQAVNQFQGKNGNE